MKNLIRIFLILTIIGGAVSLHSACSDENDCSLAGRPMMYCTIYTINPDNPTIALKDTLDSLTITALGTDSIILNNEKNVHTLMLPLRYTSDTTVFIFRYDPKRREKDFDTLYIVQQNTPYFQSMECGYMMKQNIISAKFGKPGRPGNPPPYGNGQPDQIDSLHIKIKKPIQMKSRTCRYSIIIGQNAHLMKRLISLLLLFCIGLPLLAQQQRPAQTPKRDQKKKRLPR